MKKQINDQEDYHPSVADYDDNELFEKLRERGYHGTLIKKIIFTSEESPSTSDSKNRFSCDEKDTLINGIECYLSNLEKERRILVDRDEVEAEMERVNKVLAKLKEGNPF